MGKVKTWGENPLIQEIRRKLSILKKDNTYPYRPEYGYGYQQALKDVLYEIRKVMHNEKRKKLVNEKTLRKVGETCISIGGVIFLGIRQW